jgi:membrane fusion protein, multidrug efflux system
MATDERGPDDRERRRHPARWLLAALVILGVAAFLGWRFYQEKRREKAAAAAPAPPLPVVLATVTTRDVPVYLEGLGTVTPLYTVTVRTLLDGRLENVFFKEGQEVRPGDVLAQVDPRPYVIQLHTAQGSLLRDRALLQDAELNLDRYQRLRPQNLVSQQQVDDQAALAGQYRGAVLIDRAAIDTARLNLEYARITSPIHGMVRSLAGIRAVDPGNIVHTTDTTGIVTLTQLDPTSVIFTLPQDDLERVLAELSERPLPVDAFSRSGATQLASGTLELVDNQVVATTGTLRLKAIFHDPGRKLWPNLFVKARLLLLTREGAIVVPATVPQRGPQGTFAYVVEKDSTVSVRPIQVDFTQGDLAVVKSGLTPGEQVVEGGQSQLRPGAKVAQRVAQAENDVEGGPDGGGAP